MTLTTLTFLSCPDRVDAGVMRSDVKAYDSANKLLGSATAVHGFLTGNDTGQGDPLLTLLNVGTSTTQTATLVGSPNQSIQISKTGMFSTSGKIGDTFVDLIDGSPIVLADAVDWIFRGKSESKPFAFTSNPEETYGTLFLVEEISPLSGNVVVSLKAGNQYAVYAFANLTGVAYFTFGDPTKPLLKELSHASLYTSSPLSPVSGPGTVPEPASLAIFGFGALGLGLSQLRRRRNVVSTTV